MMAPIPPTKNLIESRPLHLTRSQSRSHAPRVRDGCSHSPQLSAEARADGPVDQPQEPRTHPETHARWWSPLRSRRGLDQVTSTLSEVQAGRSSGRWKSSTQRPLGECSNDIDRESSSQKPPIVRVGKNPTKAAGKNRRWPKRSQDVPTSHPHPLEPCDFNHRGLVMTSAITGYEGNKDKCTSRQTNKTGERRPQRLERAIGGSLHPTKRILNIRETDLLLRHRHLPRFPMRASVIPKTTPTTTRVIR